MTASVTVVVPLYNEEDNVDPLVEEFVPVSKALTGLEVVLVDDGSRDGTWSRIQAAAAKHPFLRGIRSIQNAGQTSAMLIGLRDARGDIVVTMDGDLQNNPADIPALVEALLRETCDVVCGYRATRRDSWSRRAGSRIGNGIRNWVTQDGLRDTGCSLKAFRKTCVSDLPPVNGAHRFMGAYFKLHGRSMIELPVDHRPRRAGTSKYTNLKRLPKTFFDLIGFVWYRSRILKAQEVEKTR
ncbi:MAG TPA: glycosyltransferase family 2 protein [Kiritimatiellia bacterium]